MIIKYHEIIMNGYKNTLLEAGCFLCKRKALHDEFSELTLLGELLKQ